MSLIAYWSAEIAAAPPEVRPLFVAAAICAIGQKNRAVPTPSDLTGLGLTNEEIETILPGSANLVRAILDKAGSDQ